MEGTPPTAVDDASLAKGGAARNVAGATPARRVKARKGKREKRRSGGGGGSGVSMDDILSGRVSASGSGVGRATVAAAAAAATWRRFVDEGPCENAAPNRSCEVTGRGAAACAPARAGDDSGVQGADRLSSRRLSVDGCDATEALLRIQRVLSDVVSGDATTRRQVLSLLSGALFHSDGTPRLPAEALRDVFEACGRPLYLRMADPSEAVREAAVRLLVLFFRSAHDLTTQVGYFFPALMQRLSPGHAFDGNLQLFVHDVDTHDAFVRGKAVPRQDRSDGLTAARRSCSVVEPSEELRELLVDLLRTLLDAAAARGTTRIVGPYLQDALLFSVAQLRDPCPAVKVKACGLLQSVCASQELAPIARFFAVGIARALFPVLRHRHAKVRLAALRAAGAAVAVPYPEKCRGGGTEAIEDLIGFRADNVLPIGAFYNADAALTVNYLAELCEDESAAVRGALAEVLRDWMTTLPDRYDHWPRLVPYVLTLLSDDADAVAAVALDAVSRCGAEYEKEHPDKIIERRQFGVDGDARCNHALPLPRPFAQRPRIGARLFVRGICLRFLKPLMRELGAWQASTRDASARLLRVVLVFCEERIAAEAHWILPALAKALRHAAAAAAADALRRCEGCAAPHSVLTVDEGGTGARSARESESQARMRVLLECGGLLGRFLPPEVYAPLLLSFVHNDAEVVGSDGVSQTSRASKLQLLSCMMASTAPRSLATHARSLGDALCRSSGLLDSAAEALRDLPCLAPALPGCPLPHALAANQGAQLLDAIRSLFRVLEHRGGAAVSAHFLSTGRLVELESCAKNAARAALVLRGAGAGNAYLRGACDDLLRSVSVLFEGGNADALDAAIEGAALEAIDEYPRGMLWSPLCQPHLVLVAAPTRLLRLPLLVDLARETAAEPGGSFRGAAELLARRVEGALDADIEDEVALEVVALLSAWPRGTMEAQREAIVGALFDAGLLRGPLDLLREVVAAQSADSSWPEILADASQRRRALSCLLHATHDDLRRCARRDVCDALLAIIVRDPPPRDGGLELEAGDGRTVAEALAIAAAQRPAGDGAMAEEALRVMAAADAEAVAEAVAAATEAVPRNHRAREAIAGLGDHCETIRALAGGRTGPR